MKKIIIYLSTEPWRSLSFLSVLMTARLFLQVHLYKIGLLSVSADEFSRGIRAAKWALNPTINILADIQDTWLPFEKYLNGIALMVWPDVIKTPRATVFIASCLVLIALFFIVYHLSNRFSIAAISISLITIQPWFAWLSGTPMLEMYCYAFFFGGLYFFIVWLDKARKGFWLLAGISFLIASGFHYESWIYINIVNLLSLPILVHFLKKRNFSYVLKLVAYYFISNGLIITFSILTFFQTGEFISFLSAHTNYSKWYYFGYTIPNLEKFLYYPKLIINNSTWVIWPIAIIGLLLLIRDKVKNQSWMFLSLGLIALLMNSIANIFSVPATAAPNRYSLFYLIIILPFCAYGIYNLFIWGKSLRSKKFAIPIQIAVVMLFIYLLWWGASRIPQLPGGLPKETITVGSFLHHRLDQDSLSNNETYMVQLKYWDYLGVELSAGHFDSIVFDREENIYNRNTVSIFYNQPDEVYSDLLNDKVTYIALQDTELQKIVSNYSFIQQIQVIGPWTIYQFNK